MASHFGHPAYHYPSTGTTMHAAAELARQGCPEGTIVTADEQTAGRGRLGRSWVSQAGFGLYLSLVLRPPVRPHAAPMLTLVAGVGVKEALEGLTGLGCDIRWPNDILVNERKCCGILVEMETERQRVDFVIVGIGINLNHPEFPPELGDTATSLRIETGKSWPPEQVLEPVLRSLESCYDLYLESGPEPVLAAFQAASSYARGRRVVVEGGPEDGSVPVRGITAGLNEHGLLMLEDASGAVAPVIAGSVRPDTGKI